MNNFLIVYFADAPRVYASFFPSTENINNINDINGIIDALMNLIEQISNDDDFDLSRHTYTLTIVRGNNRKDITLDDIIKLGIETYINTNG